MPLRLTPGDVLDVELRATVLKPRSVLIGVEHPTVTFVNAEGGSAQRATGKETVARAGAGCATVADG